MFNEQQIKALSYELDSSRIKERSKGNITLSYLEGFDIIETANKIFGFGNWDYSITKLDQVSQEMNQNQNHIVCYKAIVTIQVHNMSHTHTINREDVGFGTGIAKTLSDAHESAAKEAVTDAIKRAMRSFGNQFGNSLYDKSRHHNQHQHNQIQHQPAQQNQIQHQQQYQQQNNNYIPQDYSSLYNLGLSIVEQGDALIVVGDDIFSKKDSIKAYGFRWDKSNKCWYKPRDQQQVA